MRRATSVTNRERSAKVLFAVTGAAVLAAAASLEPEQPAAPAQAPAQAVLTKKLGSTIPLDLTFTDEDGKEVRLREFFDKPVLLLLVYLRCPGVCSPLMHAVAHTVGQCSLEPGTDYRIVTISFDPREREQLDMVRTAKKNLLGGLTRQIDPAGWAFLTGRPAEIAAICDAVGFETIKQDEDFLHPVTITFLSPAGKITRYLSPSQSIDEFKYLPADFKMSILDASEGRVGSFMEKLERFCYGFDNDRGTYVFRVNRIIMAATLLFVAAFGVYLLRGRRGGRPAAGPEAPRA